MDYNGKNRTYRVKDGFYGEFVVDTNDIIMRHQADQYDHLRWHEYEDEDGEHRIEIALIFLGATALDGLAQAGIPEAFLDEPSYTTVTTYNQDLINRFESQFGEDG